MYPADLLEGQNVYLTARGRGAAHHSDFFQGIVQVLRGAYGRETGNKIATAFKMKYFEDIDK